MLLPFIAVTDMFQKYVELNNINESNRVKLKTIPKYNTRGSFKSAVFNRDFTEKYNEEFF